MPSESGLPEPANRCVHPTSVSRFVELVAPTVQRKVQMSPKGGSNTLFVPLIPKRVYRCAERGANRPRIATLPIAFLQKSLFPLARRANKLAWTQDQKDPDRYRYAMGFTVIAKT